LSDDWKSVARDAGFRVSLDNSIEVPLGTTRQTVHVDADTCDEALRLWSVIATPKVFEDVSDSPLRYAWERNRFSELVGFSVDRRQRLVGETWVPRDGLTSSELNLQLRELARVCDWHEFRLAGEDAY
jgi:hypothetical protein